MTRDSLRENAREQSRRRARHILLTPNRGCLAVRVTRASIMRAMRIMDVLVGEFDKQSWETRMGEKGTEVVIDGEPVAFHLQEQLKQIHLSPGKYSYRDYALAHEASGVLYLQIDTWAGGKRKWSDGRRQGLENVLGSFVEGLERVAVVVGKRRAEFEERERVRREQERLRQRERDRLRQLTEWLSGWEEAERARQFLRAAHEALGDAADVPAETSAWLEWADTYADRIDPLVSST